MTNQYAVDLSQKTETYYSFIAKGRTYTFKTFPLAALTARKICFNIPVRREIGIFEVNCYKQKNGIIAKTYDIKSYIRARYASVFYDKALWQELKQYEQNTPRTTNVR